MNKYFKRALALLCTLTLVLSLSTVFASAAVPPRVEPMNSIDNDFVATVAISSAPARSRLRSTVTSSTWVWNSTHVWSLSYAGSTISAPSPQIIPCNKCRRVSTTSGLYIRTGAGAGCSLLISSALAYNTLLCVYDSKTVEGEVWYKVRPYIGGVGYAHCGWVCGTYTALFTGN